MLKLKLRDELIRWTTTGKKTNLTEDPRDRYKTARPGSSISFKIKIRLQGIRPNWIKAILNKRREPYSWTDERFRPFTKVNTETDNSRCPQTDATKKADYRMFLEAVLYPSDPLNSRFRKENRPFRTFSSCRYQLQIRYDRLKKEEKIDERLSETLP